MKYSTFESNVIFGVVHLSNVKTYRFHSAVNRLSSDSHREIGEVICQCCRQHSSAYSLIGARLLQTNFEANTMRSTQSNG